MFRIGSLRSSNMISAAWQVLKTEKRILKAEIIGTVVVFVLLIALWVGFGALMFSTTSAPMDESTEINIAQLPFVVIMIFGTIGILTIAELFNGYILIAALARFRGEQMTHSEIMQRLQRKKWLIVKFAAFSASIGVLLSMIEEKVPFLGGKILTWIGQVAWSIASVFAMPVIVDSEEKTVIGSVKQSMSIIKKTFGDNVKIVFGITAIVLTGILITVLSALLITVALSVFSLPTSVYVGAPILIVVIGIFTIMILASALNSIVRAALYYYAVSGKAPEDFNVELLHKAITPKKARNIFGW